LGGKTKEILKFLQRLSAVLKSAALITMGSPQT